MKFKELKKKIIEIVDLIMADCGNCIHEGRCPFKDDKGITCWEENKGDYYIKKVHKNR